MNLNHTHETKPVFGKSGSLTHFCLRSCQKLLAHVGRIKTTILAEWQGRLKDHERILKLALNEAEALAWETPYPHLVFPTLAMEKAQGARDWVRHQQRIRQAVPLRALASTA
jgi:hypothetical protein